MAPTNAQGTKPWPGIYFSEVRLLHLAVKEYAQDNFAHPLLLFERDHVQKFPQNPGLEERAWLPE